MKKAKKKIDWKQKIVNAIIIILFGAFADGLMILAFAYGQGVKLW